jgi:hypothetical protein
MGLKGYRLWAMGQLDSNVQSPTAPAPPPMPPGTLPAARVDPQTRTPIGPRREEDEIPPRHWFTRAGLTNGRHAKRCTAPTRGHGHRRQHRGPAL